LVDRYTGAVPTYRLTIEYEGTKFAGWQVQASGRTVQGVLLDALRKTVGEREIDLQGAGRTDAGVHALAQVASLRCRQALRREMMLQALDRELPADVAVLDLVPAPPGFHARHDATGRAYIYQITRRRSAFGKRVSWWVREQLDVTRMARAAAAFVGRHDVRAFTKRPGEQDTTVVEVERCEVAEAADCVLVRMVASHFLWNQVRRTVGALVAVGRGESAADDVPAWFAGKPSPPALSAPAAGLFLAAVRFPNEPWVLPPMAPLALPASQLSRQTW